MTIATDWIICEHCDTLYRAVPLQPGQASLCRRCGAVLWRQPRLGLQQQLALTITAALMFVFANSFPVITISFEGLANAATLGESVKALAQGQITPMAAVMGVTVILAPLLQILLLFWLLGHACGGRVAPGFKLCMRTLEHLRPWSMLEVCLLGILVAIIKLGSMLSVHPGIGLWALAMLAVLIILISGKSVQQLWALYEART
ncbi:paraquat-inducible protein A [Pseudomonas typographi]|uniref:Paraquat-inducible protein A n=1 Tax=Pseudomonas typographi TaxID=2715964 RepID=A0ABR7Z886_9PSED|nr:paraquat-inducible protein A [Pseudomonas typographi]MBD1553872.1 paraquat-inducible protein A [Pseudomonas typographi]MBD1590053.1 paraquat-inducible protein A [Pseudomonas typographi]MBD1601707.1 paraquat-inducible protein A [Pseudomonas typographi]